MTSGGRKRTLALLLSAFVSASASGEQWVIGNQQHPWEEWGGEMAQSLRKGGKELQDEWVDWVGLGFQQAGQEAIVARIDATTDPGWLQPVRIDPSINLSFGLAQRSLRAKPISDRGHFGEAARTLPGPIPAPLNAIDGDAGTFIYNRSGVEFKNHQTLYFDLAWPFPVNRVRFYPRTGFELFYIPAYTFVISEGDPEDYVPLKRDPTGYDLWDQGVRTWSTVAEVPINTESVVDLHFPRQYVRYLSLQDTLTSEDAKTRWEIAEFEVYGEGYLPGFTYTSAILPFENAANWGGLHWHAEVDPGASLSLRTRTGQTPNPYRYYINTGIGPTGRQEVTREEYRATADDFNRKALAGLVTEDTDNWSFWSLPYTESGQTIVSPAPARFFQFELSVTSTPDARARVDSVVIEFSSPPVAQELVGELGYGEVQPGRWEQFRYAILARFGPADTGFDAVRIVTPEEVDEASIHNLVVDGTAASPDSLHLAADGFTLFLPEHRGPSGGVDSTLVEISFATRLYVHGTNLSGSVFDSRTPEALAQGILPGDATAALDIDNLQVEWELGGALLGSAVAAPNPFTPNGDGVNDRVQIDYGLFQVDHAIPVTFTVYDLSGRAVYAVTRSEQSGPGSIRWEGTDGAGALVSPGLYVWQIKADTGAGEFVESGFVSVAY